MTSRLAAPAESTKITVLADAFAAPRIFSGDFDDRAHAYAAQRRRQDHHFEKQTQCAGSADHSLHRRRRHRSGYLARQRARVRCGHRKSIQRQAQDSLDGSFRGRESVQAVQQLAARIDGAGVPRLSCLDQGTIDDARRRRHSFVERRAAPDARLVRVPASGALVQGRALAGARSVESRHGDLPREHRGHLRRHRIRSGRRGGAEAARFPAAKRSERIRQDPFRHESQSRAVAETARGASARRIAMSA